MPTISWPDTLPQEFMRDSYSEALPDNLLRDSFDTGPASVRPRQTAAPYRLSGRMIMTTTEWGILRDWVADVLIQRSLPFGFPTPGDCGDITLVEAFGTNIGDATTGGGLAAAFDGDTSQESLQSARVASATSFYVGKTFTVSQSIVRAVAWATANVGFASNGTNITLELYGKTGTAPANATDGTLLGTEGPFTDGNSISKTIESSDTTSLFDHIWLRVSGDGAAGVMAVAELQLYQTPEVLVRIAEPPTRVPGQALDEWEVSLVFEVLPS